MREQNRKYHVATLNLEKKLRQAQFIETGEEKPYHRCTLKFPYHQIMLVQQRRLKKGKLKINLINQRKIRLYNRILDVSEGATQQAIWEIDYDKTETEIYRIWKEYIDTIKVYKEIIDDRLRTDLREALSIIACINNKL